MSASTAAPIPAFAAFEQKWLAAFPEHALLRVFLPAPDWRLHAALACLAFELEQSALQILEPQIAATKLHWWREELDRAVAGQARHPIAQSLFVDARSARVDSELWSSLVSGAASLRESGSSSDLAAQLAHAAGFARPLARIETALFFGAGVSADAATTLSAGELCLRPLARLPQELAHGRLPLPLNLLARHQLARDGLNAPSPQRAAVVRDYLAELAPYLDRALASGEALTAGRELRARLDRLSIARALRAADPLAALERIRAPWRSLGYAWQAARRFASRSRSLP